MCKVILNELNTNIMKEYKYPDIFKDTIKNINAFQITISKVIISTNMNDDEIIEFFNKQIRIFKSSKPYNGIRNFTSIDEFIYIISDLEHIIMNILDDNIDIFFSELLKFITNKLKKYLISDKEIIDITNDDEVVVVKPQKKIKNEIEPEKKDLTTYNAFFKEQSLLLKDRPDIKNKMEYIAKLWNEKKQLSDVIMEDVINTSAPMDIIDEVVNKKPYKKQNISSTMKKLVWNMTIGEEIGKSKCVCCNSTYITQMSFHCGHVISESKGGETIVSNLRPICQNCNSSMGNKNMNDFMKTLK
jgi:5-methylcytosine-specific restriction endonuclease McrA